MLIKYSPGGQGCGGGYSFNPSAGYTGTLTTGLVSWWSLDEASGTRVDSITATGNDLSDNNTVTADTGMNNSAAAFASANNEFLSLAAPLFTAAPWALSLWVNAPGASGDILYLNGSTENFSYYTEGGLTTVFFATDGAPNFSSISVVPAVGWNHMIFEFGSDNAIYVTLNGVTSTAAANGAYRNGGVVFTLGAWGASANSGITGLIDEVGYWSRVLTADERTELFAAGAGVFYPFT